MNRYNPNSKTLEIQTITAKDIFDLAKEIKSENIIQTKPDEYRLALKANDRDIECNITVIKYSTIQDVQLYDKSWLSTVGESYHFQCWSRSYNGTPLLDICEAFDILTKMK